MRTSIIVISGRPDGGLHVYWLLLTPFLIQTEGDRERIKRVSREWQRLLKSKLAPFELDSTFDLVRVLRPIGTTNKKYGSTVSALVFQPDRRLPSRTLSAIYPGPSRPKFGRRQRAPRAQTSSTARPATSVTFPAQSKAERHDVTYHVACVLVEGFGLSLADALPVMQRMEHDLPTTMDRRRNCSTNCSQQTTAPSAADTCSAIRP